MSKVKISMEFDLKGSFSIPTENEAEAVLMNIGMFFSSFKTQLLKEQMIFIIEESDLKEDYPEVYNAMERVYEEKIAICDQIFNNWRVEGETDNGKKFIFTHQEPGYKETMEWVE